MMASILSLDLAFMMMFRALTPPLGKGTTIYGSKGMMLVKITSSVLSVVLKFGHDFGGAQVW
jgi:hypothetical protein